MINNVVLIGRLVKDSDKRITSNGKSVTSFTIAVNRDFQSEGEQQADFINCQCWGKLADNVELYTHKGSLVAVEGSLRSSTYQNSNNYNVYVLEVVCSKVQFLESKKSQQKQNYFENFEQYPIDENEI